MNIVSSSPDLSKYLNSFQVATDYVQPYFLVAQKLCQLWRGHYPEILDRTYSRIMLNHAHAMVQDRLPKIKANSFGSDELVSLEATSPIMELSAEQAEAWIRDMFRSESKLNITAEIEPTLQSTLVCGTGYRMPCVKHIKVGEKWTPQIMSKHVDFFQILPMPDGGLINPMDRWSEDAVSSFFFVDFMTDDQIRAYEKYEGYDKKEAEKLFKTAKASAKLGVESGYRDSYLTVGGVSYSSKDDWRQRMLDISNDSDDPHSKGRRRVVHWYGRDFWWIIVQDQFVVFKGKNPMGESGLLPLVKYCITPDFTNWFGIGCLEMITDLIEAIMMNFNYRMDYMMQVMAPMKWIRQDVMGGKDDSDFYYQPNKVNTFPRDVQQIANAVWFDRIPDISNQTFLEEDHLEKFLQQVSGMSNYQRGMGGGETTADRSATGTVTMVNQGSARINAESLYLEYSGLSQEARLLLVLADKHITEDQVIRNSNSKTGFPWTTIESEALGDKYIVHTRGTRYLADKQQTFQKLLSLYPLWNQNPMFDQYQLNKTLAESAGAPEIEKLVRKPIPGQMPMAGMPTDRLSEAGGMASGQNFQNPQRSVNNRNTAEPNTGKLVPAGMPL